MRECNAPSIASSICSTRALNQLLQRRRRRGAAPRAERRCRRPSARSTGRSRSSRCDGITVRMARSLDRPMRYFLAKRHEGPALFVADRIDTLQRALAEAGLDGQFHPSYTRMVPAHHIVELALVGLSRSGSRPTRASSRRSAATLSAGSRRDRPALHRRAVRRDREVAARHRSATDARGADRRQLLRRHRQRLGVPRDVPHDAAARHVAGAAQGVRAGPGRRPGRRAGARSSCPPPGCRCSSRRSSATPDDLDVEQTLRVLEDYKSLDVECAAMGLLLCKGIRERYPDWRYLARRRRRRREPEGLSDRGEPRAHDPQRRRQPDALSGRLGRRPHQALAHLQRRPEPQLRADVRAGARSTGSTASAPTRGRTSSRSPKAIPFADADAATTCRRSTR